MRVGKPFKIAGIANSGDTFVPLHTTCRKCKKKMRLFVPEPFARELYGARTIECYECYENWGQVFETLGSEGRAQYMAVRHVTLDLRAL